MLPFLKNKQDGSSSTGLIVKERKPDESQENHNKYEGLEVAMEELSTHLFNKDYKAAAECFKSAFELCESQPHDETNTEE